MITHYHLSWNPQENIVISFSDETGENRSVKQIDAFFEELRETAGKHGFDIQHWGNHDQVFKYLFKAASDWQTKFNDLKAASE